ncbi:MAG: hypothetical protein WCL32_25370 [Planctomycetota bacterium]
MDVIAEHHLVATYSDGASGPVTLRVGRPFAHPLGDHACSVQAEGLRLWEGPKEIFGVGTWQALVLGLRLLRSILSAEAERGTVFRWESGEDAVSVDELFVLRMLS